MALGSCQSIKLGVLVQILGNRAHFINLEQRPRSFKRCEHRQKRAAGERRLGIEFGPIEWGRWWTERPSFERGLLHDHVGHAAENEQDRKTP